MYFDFSRVSIFVPIDSHMFFIVKFIFFDSDEGTP